MELFYQRNDSILERYLSKVRRMVSEEIPSDKEIYLFGYSSVSLVTAADISASFPERRIRGCVDNNTSVCAIREEETREEYQIHPVSFLKGKQDTSAVLISSQHHASMSKQLKELGFEPGTGIFVVTDLSNEHNDYSFADRSGYERLSTNEIKLLQLDMLRYLKRLCDENGISYYLAYGTLLGAVRDQGMIPWDDDIDVYVMGYDMDRLTQLINNDGLYQLITSDNNKDFFSSLGYMINPRIVKDTNLFPLAYTTGLVLDIFPLWDQPNDEEKNEFIRKFRFIEDDLQIELGRNRSVDISTGKKMDYLRSFSANSENIGHMHFGYTPEVLKRKWFSKTVEVVFEGDYYHAPIGFEQYLQQIYGTNYMSPPASIENRSHRSRYYINKDKMYTGDGVQLNRELSFARSEKLKYENLGKSQQEDVHTIAFPSEWELATRKSDGTRKKVILYDIGLASVLLYGTKMVDKIEYCIQVFEENKDDISVLWHTRGRSDENLNALEPTVGERYCELRDKFEKENLGIYDDGTDDTIAIFFCDAYYGVGGAIAQKCKERGIPVMVQNVEILG